MKMKLDKETLLKHHYWLVAAGALVVSLAAIFLLRTAVRAGITSEKKKLDDEYKKISDAAKGDVASRASIEKTRADANGRKSVEEKVWRDAFREQEPSIRWARKIEEKYQFTAQNFFATEVTLKPEDADLGVSKDPSLFAGIVETKDASKMTVRGKVFMPQGDGKDAEVEIVKTFSWHPPVIVSKEGEDKLLKLDAIEPGNKVLVANKPLAGMFITQLAALGDDAALEATPRDDFKFQGIVQERDNYKMVVKGKVKVPLPERIKPEDGTTELTEEVTWTFFRNDPPGKPGGEEVLSFLKVMTGSNIQVTFERGRYFLDRLTVAERTDFESSYTDQFAEVFAQVDPLRLEDPYDPTSLRGVVQLYTGGEGGGGAVGKGGFGAGGSLAGALGNTSFWPFNPKELPPPNARFFRYVPRDKLNLGVDFSELAWLAQEDIWIYKEIYRLVDQANAYVREFKSTAIDKGWAGENAYWDLHIEPAGEGQVTLKLTNRLVRRQPLGIYLKVWFKGTKEPVEIPVGGIAPLNPRGMEGSFFRTKPFDLEGNLANIEKVEQKLTWDLAAVRRIDEVLIGADVAGQTAHSHRTVPMAVKEYKEEPKPEVPAGDDGKGPPMGKGIVPGPGDIFGNPGGGKDGGIPFSKKRYLEVSPQARRIPVMVTLIIDQQHFDRVQVSFANSKMRFLTTQVLMNRFPGSVNPVNRKGADASPGGGIVPKFGPPMFPMEGAFTPMGTFGPGPMGPGPMGPGPMPMGPGYMPGSEVGGPGMDFNQSRTEDNESNVEVVIYGIMTLYERYPGRANAAAP